MTVEHPFYTLYKESKNLYERISLELSATQHRPEGWLPRTVFVENDEYENGFVKYEVREIHPDGTFTGLNMETYDEEQLYLREINLDFLMLLMELYIDSCVENNLTEEIRRCDHCGKPMKKGYYFAGEFACSDECCLALYKGDAIQMKEDLSKADTDKGECYYTEWESFSLEY